MYIIFFLSLRTSFFPLCLCAQRVPFLVDDQKQQNRVGTLSVLIHGTGNTAQIHYCMALNTRHKHSLAAKVKEDIEVQETDNDIFSDIYMSSANAIRGLIYRW